MWVSVLDGVGALRNLPDSKHIKDVLLLTGLDEPPVRDPALGVRCILIVLKLADEVIDNSLAAAGPLHDELEV